MEKINRKDYAEFLEKTLQNMIELPVEGICIVTKLKGGGHMMSFFNSSPSDKIAYAGMIQQDAMIDTLKANNWISDKDDNRE